jgi:hypothetical protein
MAFPRGPRKWDRTHVGIRFDDGNVAIIEVTVNRQDVTLECFEAVEGVEGYAYCFTTPRHACTCGKGICSERRDGVVLIGHQHKITAKDVRN